MWHIPLLSVQWINSWWQTDELSETCRVSWQNKFVKLVHLVGFITNKSVTMHGHINVKKKFPVIIIHHPRAVSRWSNFYRSRPSWFLIDNIPQLTLILLTWRIWWAPNNASKWQMGINSAFRRLIRKTSHIFSTSSHLLQWRFSRVVDVDHRHVSQESMRQRFPTRISWRITGTHELNSLQRYPRLVRSAEEAAMFHKLTEERYHSLRAILIHVWQVDFITEQHKPFT